MTLVDRNAASTSPSGKRKANVTPEAAAQKTQQYEIEKFNKRIAVSTSFLQRLPADRLRGAKVVDIGCGYGAMAIACLEAGCAEYVGIDPFLFNAHRARHGVNAAGRDFFDTAVRERHLDGARAIFISAFAENIHCIDGYFDVCVSIDVFEHVADLPAAAHAVARFLRPSGLACIQASPLFFSPWGHHIFKKFDDEPWAHLKPDFASRAAARGANHFQIEASAALNRKTASEIESAFVDKGLDVLKRDLFRKGEDLSLDTNQFSILPPTGDDLYTVLVRLYMRAPGA